MISFKSFEGSWFRFPATEVESNDWVTQFEYQSSVSKGQNHSNDEARAIQPGCQWDKIASARDHPPRPCAPQDPRFGLCMKFGTSNRKLEINKFRAFLLSKSTWCRELCLLYRAVRCKYCTVDCKVRMQWTQGCWTTLTQWEEESALQALNSIYQASFSFSKGTCLSIPTCTDIRQIFIKSPYLINQPFSQLKAMAVYRIKCCHSQSHWKLKNFC